MMFDQNPTYRKKRVVIKAPEVSQSSQPAPSEAKPDPETINDGDEGEQIVKELHDRVVMQKEIIKKYKEELQSLKERQKWPKHSPAGVPSGLPHEPFPVVHEETGWETAVETGGAVDTYRKNWHLEREQNSRLQTRIMEQQGRIDALIDDLKISNRYLGSTRVDLDKALSENQELRIAATPDILMLQSENKDLKLKNRKKEEELQAFKAQMEEMQELLRQKEADLRQCKSTMSLNANSANCHQKQQTQLQKQLSESRGKIQHLNKTIKDLTQENLQLKEKLEIALKDSARAQSGMHKAQNKVTSLKREAAQLQKECADRDKVKCLTEEQGQRISDNCQKLKTQLSQTKLDLSATNRTVSEYCQLIRKARNEASDWKLRSEYLENQLTKVSESWLRLQEECNKYRSQHPDLPQPDMKKPASPIKGILKNSPNRRGRSSSSSRMRSFDDNVNVDTMPLGYSKMNKKQTFRETSNDTLFDGRSRSPLGDRSLERPQGEWRQDRGRRDDQSPMTRPHSTYYDQDLNIGHCLPHHTTSTPPPILSPPRIIKSPVSSPPLMPSPPPSRPSAISCTYVSAPPTYIPVKPTPAYCTY